MGVESRPKGSRIGRYELRDRVGEGGMGNVYRAVDTKMGRTVAVKLSVPSDGRQLTEQLRERFLREVLAISRIDHPNVVKVYDYGIAKDGTPYLVMEYLEGQDLARFLRESRQPLPVELVADIMLEVCAALKACHELSVVHRDLKPANIFLARTESGSGWQVKIVDFGVSKAATDGELTEHGQIIGTWQYLSPEQVNGWAEPASDQYALGVLLYVCLTKRLPYGGLKDAALLRAIDRGAFKNPRMHRPEIPEALEAIILRAMHVSPQARFESVYALGKALWEFASPLGRETWKKFYVHSPFPMTAHREISEGIPIALVRSLAGRRADTPPVEDHTEVAHYESPTDASPEVADADRDAEPAESDFDSHTPTFSNPSSMRPTLIHLPKRTTADDRDTGVEEEPRGSNPKGAGGGHRQLLARAGALLAVAVAGVLAWAAHRPETHLIRPGMLSGPVDRVGGREPPKAPASPDTLGATQKVAGPSAEISPIPAHVKESPIEVSPGADAPRAPVVSGAGGAPDKTGGAEPEANAAPRPKKRRPHPRPEVETTPDGVPLLR